MGNGQSVMYIKYSEQEFLTYIQENEMSEYRMRDHKQYQDFKKEIETFHPCILEFTMNQESGSVYFEYANLYLEHPDLKFKITRQHKKYSIFCESIQGFKNISYHHINDCAKGLTEPQQIGVLTAKKINNWIRYYEELYERVAVKSREHDDVKDKFIQSIEGLPAIWNNDRDGGSLISQGIELKFKLYPGHVSMDIGIHYAVGNTVANFISLAQNKY